MDSQAAEEIVRLQGHSLPGHLVPVEAGQTGLQLERGELRENLCYSSADEC